MEPNYEALWAYFVETAKEIGWKDDNKQEQSAFSLFKAFYGTHCHYPEDHELVDAYFGKEKLNDSLVPQADLDKKLTECFGEEALQCIENNRAINAEQRLAVKNGLLQPVTLVQGPPGTGKTEMILNFLATITKLDPAKTVAVVSCNNEALKNISDELARSKETDEFMSAAFDHFAVLGNKGKREEWCACVPRRYIADDHDIIFYREMLKEYPLFISTIHSLPKIFDNYDELFDYVIVDECSQVSVSLGLIAMAHAKHLMLVGDNLQLQAIIDSRATDIPRELENYRQFLEEQDKSFLMSCKNLIKGAPDITLRDHYRCHPSIASFCNKYVYNGKLKVKKKDDGECRIDITYYDGVFMEQPDRAFTEMHERAYIEKDEPLPEPAKADKLSSQKHNFKQIEIFLKEMLPDLKAKFKDARLQGKPLPSVCVISPIRVQLEFLRKRLWEVLEETLDEDDISLEDQLLNSEDDEEDFNVKESLKTLQKLSIHKSQGKGYDIIYLLTTEDDPAQDSNPWGQNMRIINVAASRAKDELHVITSRIWIPRYIQEKLPDYDNNPAPLPACFSKGKAANEAEFYSRNPQKWPEEEENDVTKTQYYIGRLCQWVYDNWGANPTENSRGTFGFKKAKTTSVFDGFNKTQSSHELIKRALIARGIPEENIVTNRSITDVLEIIERDPNLAQYGYKDFIFILENGFIKTIIHVTDIDYRNACRPHRAFQKMLKAVMTSGYIEIPTNGMLNNETYKILAVCNKSRAVWVYAPYENKFIKALNAKTHECLRAVKNMIWNDAENDLIFHIPDEIKDALELNFSKATDVTYAKLTQRYYLCRYGTAYAFEYAMMYDIVLRLATAEKLDILSLGCGSGIDKLAAEYSAERRGKSIKSYQGVDRELWEERFVDEKEIEKDDIVEFLRTNNTISQNVIFFPKILNELDDNARGALVKAAESCSLDPSVKEYFFCVSHSKAYAERDIKLVSELINALTKGGGEYETKDLVAEALKDNDFKHAWGLQGRKELTEVITDEKEQVKGVYNFNWSLQITDFNPDFSDEQTKREMELIVDKLKQHSETYRHRVKNTGAIAFQIVQVIKK